MIIIYATETYFKWVPIFIESFRLTNGKSERILVNGDNFTPKMCKIISSNFENVDICNHSYRLKDLAQIYNVDVNILKESRQDCTDGKIKGKHRIWMNITADDRRIHFFKEAIYNNPDEEYYIHMDVDFLFRGDISNLFEMVKTADVGLCDRIRPQKKTFNGINPSPPICQISKDKRRVSDSKITICFVSLLNNGNAKYFLNKWLDYIDSVPLLKREHIKYGQYAIYQAFYECLKNNECTFWREKPTLGYIDGTKNKSNESKIYYFRKKRKMREYEFAVEELKRIRKGFRVNV